MVKDAEKQAPTPQNQVRRTIDFPSLLVLLLLLYYIYIAGGEQPLSYRVSPRRALYRHNIYIARFPPGGGFSRSIASEKLLASP